MRDTGISTLGYTMWFFSRAPSFLSWADRPARQKIEQKTGEKPHVPAVSTLERSAPQVLPHTGGRPALAFRHHRRCRGKYSFRHSSPASEKRFARIRQTERSAASVPQRNYGRLENG